MYVRKRKTLGTTATNERFGGKDSHRDSSRGHAAEVNQRDYQSRNVSERRNLPYNSESRSDWSSQRSQENRHSETQRPPPFKSLIDDPVGRRETFSDRRNADFSMDRGYQNKSNDNYNCSRTPYGERHDRWNPYDQRESSNRGNYMESQRRNEDIGIKNTMEKIFNTDFRFGNIPFANIERVDDRCGMNAQRGGNNSSQMNQDDMSYSGRRNDSYYSDRRDEPYYSDKRGYGYSDRRRESSPERRGHSSYSERRGDSYSERGHGSYPGRRGGEPSPERGNFGYYQGRKESDSYPARRYESHSERRSDNSYGDKGYASYRDRRDGDSFSDRRGSDYYTEKRNSDPYPDGRGSPYADGRGSASYMDYERSSNLSYKDPHRGANIPFMNRERVDNSYHVDQQRRVDSSYESWQKQDSDSYLDKPRGRSYPTMGTAMEESIAYENEKKRIKGFAKGQRSNEGRSTFGDKPRRSNQGDGLKLPSKDEKRAAMGILKKVLAKQQNSKSRRGLPSTKPDHDGIQNSESSGDLGNRNDHPSKRGGGQGSIRKGYQGRKVEGNVRKELPRKRPLETNSSIQNKKPRISVLSRLGPKLETASKEVFSRLGSRTVSVKSRLGPRSFPSILPGQDNSDTGEPFGQKKLSRKDCAKMAKKYKHLSASVLKCNKCKQSKFSSVQNYLVHQIEEHHEQIDASFHKKIESLYKYLRCDAQLAYARETGGVPFRRAIICEICGVREKVNKPHFKTNNCKVVHEYANPNKCCQFGKYSDRSFFENHIHSLTHFVKKSKMFFKIQKRYQTEKKKMELMKNSYLNGVRISKTKFLHEVLWREAKVCEHFGEVPVPEEVSSLLQTFEDLAEPLPVGKVLNRIKKLEAKYYDPSNVHGKYQIIFETNFKCELCGIVLERSQQSLIDHCSTKEHYDNVVKEQQRLREKASEVKVKEEKDDVTETENSGNKENEASKANKDKNVSQQNEEDGNDDFDDTEVYGDHHDGKVKQAQKELVAEKEDNKPASKKTDRRENEDVKEIEIDKVKESEQPEEIQDELGEENDKHEDDDIDIYSDPYGGGELLEGVEERQEVGCDNEESGEDGNAQEQDDEDEANEEASSDNDAEVC